jgi:succinate-semialdehyde dehydrogenase/glutarate-semialdehyde dehydrogenase
MAIASINPATGEQFATYQVLTEQQLNHKLQTAHEAYLRHRETGLSERSKKLLRAAEILEEESEDFGATMTVEMGKTLKSAIAEAKKCATACRYYAENGARQLSDEVIATGASRSFVRYQPLGPVLAVMPWNFPFWQVFRFAAPALMAGNVGLLKHSSNVPGCALAIEDILRRAGFDGGEFQTLLIDSKQVEAVLDDDRVAAATLTGSEPAGRSVASRAGKQIKKTVLELGGSDPFIVMPSTDLTSTVKAAVSARTINNGQSCIAAKRFIVHESIYAEFERQFTESMSKLRIGDPMEDATDIGPLATGNIRDELHEQVKRAQADGCKVLTGGYKIDGPGFFYAPTVLTDVPHGSSIFHEELFGPVAMMFRAKNADDAVRIANDSPFGLGSSVWTNDEREMEAFIDGIEAGQVFVNAPVASDARLPFGGIKRSGYGRELSAIGIREFVNVKTVWCK